MNLKNLFWLGFGLLFGFIVASQNFVFADKKLTKTSKIPLKELEAFSQIFYNIKKTYVDEVDNEKLINNAISGMVSGLDPHSSYLLPEDFGELKINTEGKFGGLGIEIGMEDGFVKVISPIDDTPAAKAGVKSGDLIILLDKTSVKGMTLNDAVKIMRGKPGEPITLTIVREGENQPKKIKIVRDIINIKSVRQRLLEPGFGYIRISQFQEQTYDNLKQSLEKLTKENSDKKINGLVLDLRNNPGGVLDGAIDVSDAFLEQGLIVYTEGKTSKSKTKFKAAKGDLVNGAPIVVLINNGSASASEIVAGALQDHKRAIILGSKTFGKGSVQTVLPMRNGAALKITTALYYTPSGRSIQAKGIIPDIEVKPIKIESDENPSDITTVLEKDLSGHLEIDDSVNGKQADKKPKSQTDSKKNGNNLIKEDFVLHEALNLLKGLHLLRKL